MADKKKKSELSRQRLWQKERVKAGFCMICSRKRKHYAQLCDFCQEMRKRRYRARGIWKKWKPGSPGRVPYVE